MEEKKKLDAQLTTQNMDLLLLIQEKDNLENKLSDKEIEGNGETVVGNFGRG